MPPVQRYPHRLRLSYALNKVNGKNQYLIRMVSEKTRYHRMVSRLIQNGAKLIGKPVISPIDDGGILMTVLRKPTGEFVQVVFRNLSMDRKFIRGAKAPGAAEQRRHEMMHGFQQILHEKLNFKLNDNTELAHFEERVLFPFFEKNTLRKFPNEKKERMKPYSQLRIKLHRFFDAFRWHLVSRFNTRQELLAVINELFTDPKMRPVLQRMNKSFLTIFDDDYVGYPNPGLYRNVRRVITFFEKRATK
ncbi:MAG: hypothetical protein AABX02_02890 [archaeon]